MEITKDISIEDLVDLKKASVRYLSEKGIKCIACGEPIWGTLEEAAREKGFGEDEIEEFVRELNSL
jgi:methionine synthase II (cobalamin-independent)